MLIRRQSTVAKTRAIRAALANPNLDAIPRYATASRETGSTQTICLASNENPYGASPRVKSALQAELHRLERYPDPEVAELRQDLARHMDLPDAQVLVGNGATELIDLVSRAFLRPGDNTVHADPSFVMFQISPATMGVKSRGVPLRDDGGFDIDGLLGRVDGRTKLLFVANPNNPTGCHMTRSEMDRLVRFLPDHVVLVLDEAYREYVVATDCPDGLRYLARRQRLIVMRTFSKAFGLAGLRIGYLATHPELITSLRRASRPFSVSSLAQSAARAALTDRAHIVRSRQNNRIELERITERLDDLGCRVRPSQANFVLVDFCLDAAPVVEALADRGIQIRSMLPYQLPTCGRITVGTHSQNEALIRSLADILPEISSKIRPAA